MGAHLADPFAQCASRVASLLSAAGETDGGAHLQSDVHALLTERLTSARSPEEAWQLGSKCLLELAAPFEAHAALYTCLAEHVEGGVLPAWTPEPTQVSNLSRLVTGLGLAGYADLYEWSIADPNAYWAASIDALHLQFEVPPRAVRGAADDFEAPRWLEGAKLNVARASLDGSPESVALITRNGDLCTTYTKAELAHAVRRAAVGLSKLGITAGDRVAISVPLGFDAITGYLALIYIGAVVVCIAESYSDQEIATRLEITKPKWVLTAHAVRRGGKVLPLYEKFTRVNAPPAIVVTEDEVALRSGDAMWRLLTATESETNAVSAFASPMEMPNTVLFSSGTTGTPKAILWTPGCAIKAAADAKWHLDVRSGDRLMWPTSLGWMMGAWSIFATLLNDAALVVFDDAPTLREFGLFAQLSRVTHLGVVPSLVRNWRETRNMEGLDLRCVRVFSSTGECSNPIDMLYLMWLAHYRPVIEYCGGTEIAGGYLTSTVLSPCVPSCFTTAALGQGFVCLDEAGHTVREGEAFLTMPSIGLSTSLLNKDHHDEYYAGVPRLGLRRHGDLIQEVNNGYFRVLGRADDTMNLGGIKVSSAEIERACQDVPGVSELAAIAGAPAGGGPSSLVIFVVPSAERVADEAQLSTDLQRRVREQVNPLFKVERVVLLDALPRTASNKVMRRALRSHQAELTANVANRAERTAS